VPSQRTGTILVIVEERSSEEGGQDVTSERTLYIQLGLGTEDDSAFNRREGDFSVPRCGTNMNGRENKVGAAIQCLDLMLEKTRDHI
jgi:hypothetical protein